jgi:hypothetical protein
VRICSFATGSGCSFMLLWPNLVISNEWQASQSPLWDSQETKHTGMANSRPCNVTTWKAVDEYLPLAAGAQDASVLYCPDLSLKGGCKVASVLGSIVTESSTEVLTRKGAGREHHAQWWAEHGIRSIGRTRDRRDVHDCVPALRE